MAFQSTRTRATLVAGTSPEWMKLSIHAPARGATRLSPIRRFNPRPRTGGDGSATVVGPISFQWRALGQPDGFVSIHAPARGATRGRSCGPRQREHRFNPRPRTGGDLRMTWCQEFPAVIVSIRAPARGATARLMESHQVYGLGVSIRAPARGATNRDRWTTCRTLLTFQSAPPHGGRRRSAHAEHVSFRAPARGATIGSQRGREALQVSIRAPARGATTDDWCQDEFQSAPPHGGRPWRHPRVIDVLFQSAPPHGGRPRSPASRRAASVSIRAPAPTDVILHSTISDVFQSAPPHGGRPRACAGNRTSSA